VRSQRKWIQVFSQRTQADYLKRLCLQNNLNPNHTMNNSAPVFSIIIATHSRPLLLDRAIRSVCAQTYPHKQLIVISDVNDPASYAVASAAMGDGDCYIERKGRAGPSESRNMGLSLVSGDYFIFLDDDDSFELDFLERSAQQLAAIAPDHNARQFFYTNFEVVNEQVDGTQIVTGQVSKIDVSAQMAANVYVKNFVPNNCVIYPRKLAAEIRFDAEIPYEDWDFILNAYDRMPLRHLPLYGPKIHTNASSESEQRGKNNESTLLQCYLAVYGKHQAPTAQISTLRRDLFASLGLDLDALLQAAPGAHATHTEG
jgi:glycosyltransferase involved in cell wall biosynthesis